MTDDCPELERTHALADGELDGAEADAARDHLATCERCQAELADLMQLEAVSAPKTVATRDRSDHHKPDRALEALIAKHAAPAKVVDLAWYRSRRFQLGAAVVALAAAALVYLSTRRRTATPSDVEPPRIALADKRATEARLAWSGASAYRPYDVPRAAEAPHESIPLDALAGLERAGDLHGVGALALLAGERKQAETYLDRAGAAPDVLADRAALALADGDPAKALGLADAALEQAPDLAAAAWNRALALRDLNLGATAADAFRAIAKRNEPGWSDEAGKRAAALAAQIDSERALTERVIAARDALVATGAGLDPADARALPGFSRLAFYDALRAAPTADRLAKLRPLADAIDGGPAALARTQPRGALSETYAKIVAGQTLEPAARAKYLAALRAAHADDLLIGALIQTSPDRRVVAPADLPELAKLAAAAPDPWLNALGLEQQGRAALAARDLPAAEAALLRARALCPSPTPAFRCVRIDQVLGEVYLAWQRLPEARTALGDAWKLAHAQRDWYAELDLLGSLAKLVELGDDASGTGISLVRAYADELALRSGGCNERVRAHYLIAMELTNELRVDAGRRELAGVDECDGTDPWTLATHLYVRAQLYRTRATDAEVAELRRQIGALRDAAGTPPAARALLDHAEGRLVIDRDPKAADALLRRSIALGNAAPAADIDAHRAAAFSYAMLVLAAGKRGDGTGALALIAEEQGIAAPARCALGLAADDERELAVALDGSGAAHVAYDEHRTSTALDPAALVPPALAAALDGCPIVDVLARPPLHGLPRVLPDRLAWRYATARPHPLAPPPHDGDARDVVVADAEPPAALGLPRLAAWNGAPADLTGAAATPSRVLAALGHARVAVIDAHGVVDAGGADGSYLALSPDTDGRYELTAAAVRAANFPSAPVVILAACSASQAAPIMHAAWSLPAAFIAAGARAVIASAAPIPDADAAAFFDDVRARLGAGTVDVAVAIRDARQQWLAGSRGDWVRDILVFE